MTGIVILFVVVVFPLLDSIFSLAHLFVGFIFGSTEFNTVFYSHIHSVIKKNLLDFIRFIAKLRRTVRLTESQCLTSTEPFHASSRLSLARSDFLK